jgi:2'-5' RNA ligase
VSNLVIVAIPDENDRVWKISSEKVPHLTLLFLGESGEVGNLDQIVQFVEHAANTTLGRFYLPVDRRGELGDDPELGPADVLFFKRNRWDFRAVWDFRSALLKDSNIKTAYDSASQHDGPWLPHLTLGYQNRPAKADDTDRDFGFYDVSFNKIAVWTDDYDGPEFLLKDPWDEWETLEEVPLAVAMSGIVHHDADPFDQRIAMGSAFLEHHGVKGMRWGVRKDENAGPGRNNQMLKVAAVGNYSILSPKFHTYTSTNTKVKVGLFGQFALLDSGVRSDLKQASAKVNLDKSAVKVGTAIGDAQFESKVADKAKKQEVQSQIVSKANEAFRRTDLPALKNKPEYQKAKKLKHRLFNPKDPATKAYRKEAKETYISRLEEAANTMTNVSGTRQYTIRERGWELPPEGGALPASKHYWDISSREIRHADGDVTTILELTLDDDGFITDMQEAPTGDALAQSTIELGSDFLAALGLEVGVEHYGVKGMRWGVRKEAPEAVSAKATSVVPQGKRRRTKIEVEGGENHPAHEDAIKVAEAKTKLKKSGPAALSNRELQEVATRLNLERNVAQLVSGNSQTAKARQFIKNVTNPLKDTNDAANTGLQTVRLAKQIR